MMMFRCRLVMTLVAWGMIATIGLAQPEEPTARPGALAILIRNPDPSDGAPPFALADQFGRVQRLVEESPRFDLGGYVGRRVRIRHDTGRTLLASQLELPPRAEVAPLREVSPAQFVPPSRARRIDRSVRNTQATDNAFEDFLGEAAESLPTPPAEASLPESRDTTPIDLDSLPEPSPTRSESSERLDPIPVDRDAYETAPVAIEPIRSSHPADCPHCRERHREHAPEPAVCDCPRCRSKVASGVNLCKTCGRSPGWCGPTCNPASRRGVYGRVDYLLWWFSGLDTPPLATTNDLGNAPIIGQDGTRVVFGGNNDLLDDPRSGLRFTVGAWLDDQRDLAIEADWLFFETESETFAFDDQAGNLVLGRPFFNIAPVNAGVVGPPQEDVQIISLPGQAGGGLQIYTRSEFESAGIRLRTGICCREVGGSCNTCDCDQCLSGRSGRPRAISRIDFTGGYRYARLDELIRFAENSTFLTGPNTGGRVDVGEGFRTDNDFHGVDLGFVYDWQARRWGLELSSRIAIGGTRQRVTINGVNTISVPGAAAGLPSQGGLLAQTSNIGSFTRDRFSVLPELSARLSYRVTPQLNLSAGYTLLYWANVVRPGDQIDSLVDGRLASGALIAPTPNTPPNFDFVETSLWAHGFNFGLDYQY